MRGAVADMLAPFEWADWRNPPGWRPHLGFRGLELDLRNLRPVRERDGKPISAGSTATEQARAYSSYVQAKPNKRTQVQLLRMVLGFSPKGSPDYERAKRKLEELEREGY